MEIQNPTFFKHASKLHRWFEKKHGKSSELWIAFYTVKSKKDTITYKEAMDEALCFGWIDGIRKNIDEDSYAIRFTPRKAKSIWSNVNTRRFNELIKEKRVQPSGTAAFKKRVEEKSGIYSFEQGVHKLSAAFEKKFRANKKAWKFFTTKPPWYQRTSVHWVITAKLESTRLKRLETLINDSENERTIRVLTRTSKK